MSADMSSAVSNKGKSSGLGETKYFQYNPSTRTLMFLYNGFLDVSNVRDMGVENIHGFYIFLSHPYQ